MILKHLRFSGTSWLTVAAGLLASTCAVTVSALGLAVGISQESLQPGVVSAQQSEWIVSITGFNLGICLLVMMFVASMSVRVLIAQQRLLLGQLALLGATPGQLFRLVMTELAIVTVLCGSIGVVLALLAVRPTLTWVWEMMKSADPNAGVTAIDLTVTPWWWILGAIGVAASVLAVVLGAARRTWILVHLWPRCSETTLRHTIQELRRQGYYLRAAGQIIAVAVRSLLVLGVVVILIGTAAHVHSVAEHINQGTTRGIDAEEQLASGVMLTYMGAVLLLGLAGPWVSWLLAALLQRVVPSRLAPAWLSVRALNSRIAMVGSVSAVAGVSVLLPAGLASMSATLGSALPASNPVEAYVALFTLPCTIALIGSLSGVIALRGERSRERLQLSILGATDRQNTAALLIEAALMVLIAGVLSCGADGMIALVTGWSMQEVLHVGSVHFAWLFFAVCMGSAGVLLVAAVLVPGCRVMLSDLHRD